MLNKLIIDPILNLFRFHKKKVLAFIGFFFFFLYILFPFNDLGDLVTAQISKATNDQVFVDFNNIDLSLFPQPGLSMKSVTVETPFAPALTAKYLSVSPNLLGLLAFKPGVNIRASGFMGGDIDLTAGAGGKTQTSPSHRRQKLSIDLSQLSLNSMAKMASSPLKFDGSVSGNLESELDPEFSEQPTAEIDFKSEKTMLPEGNITTPFGAIGLPSMNLGAVSLQGHMDKGQLEVTKFVAGRKGGDLYISATGKMDVKILKYGPNIQPQPGAYDFTVQLQMGDAVRQKLGPFLGILQNYQVANTYSFRVSAPNTFSPPNLTKAAGL